MKIQAYLTAFVVNAKRMMKLVSEKQALFQINLDVIKQKIDILGNKKKDPIIFKIISSFFSGLGFPSVFYEEI